MTNLLPNRAVAAMPRVSLSSKEMRSPPPCGGPHVRDTPEDVGADAADAGGLRTARLGHEFGTTIAGPRHRLGEEDVGAGAGAWGSRTARLGHELATTIGGPRHRLGVEGVGAARRGLYDRNYPTLYTRGIRCVDFLRDGLQFVSQLLVLLEESLVHPLQFLEPLLDRHRSSSGRGRSRSCRHRLRIRTGHRRGRGLSQGH